MWPGSILGSGRPASSARDNSHLTATRGEGSRYPLNGNDVSERGSSPPAGKAPTALDDFNVGVPWSSLSTALLMVCIVGPDLDRACLDVAPRRRKADQASRGNDVASFLLGTTRDGYA